MFERIKGVISSLRNAIRPYSDYTTVRSRYPCAYTDLRAYDSDYLQMEKKVISAISSHLSLMSFEHIKHFENDDGIQDFDVEKTDLSWVLKYRTNSKQTPTDFWNNFFQNLFMYGNAIAVPIYEIKSKRSNPEMKLKGLECLDMRQYSFGLGYEEKKGKEKLLIKHNRTSTVQIFDYDEVIHLRKDSYAINNNDQEQKYLNDIPKILNKQLSTMLAELESNFDIKMIFQKGAAPGMSYSPALIGDEGKGKDQVEEIIERVNKDIIIIDAGEKVTKMDMNFKKSSQEEIDWLAKEYYSTWRVPKEIIDGTADYKTISIFFNNKLEPIAKNLKEELNYKLLTREQIEDGEEVVVKLDKLSGASLSELVKLFDKGVYSGFMNRNEVRSVLGWRPISGGDEYYSNRNQANLDGTIEEAVENAID